MSLIKNDLFVLLFGGGGEAELNNWCWKVGSTGRTGLGGNTKDCHGYGLAGILCMNQDTAGTPVAIDCKILGVAGCDAIAI